MYFTGKIEELWAKSDENGNPVESLIDHMKAVGAVAERLLTDSLYCDIRADLSKWLGIPEREVVPLIKYLAAMHDIGKAHPVFQGYNGNLDLGDYSESNPLSNCYRHEYGSCSIASRIWNRDVLFDPMTSDFFSFVLQLHHQRHYTGKDWYITNKRKEWESFQDAIEKEIRTWSGVKPMELYGDADAACTLIVAIIIICDWMASSGNVDGAFDAMKLAKADTLRASSFEELFGFKERTIQKELIEHLQHLDSMPLLAIIEAPMGEGKTEAGMYLAYRMAEYWHKNGLYFALPTTATSSQMVGRVQKVVKNTTDLIHSTSWLMDDENLSKMDWEQQKEYQRWKAPKKRALFARFGVGTVDQVMTTVIKVRYGVLRLLGLSNKVVIIDELHSYDAYMSTIIARLLEWCRDLRIPVVMLSATLPKARKTEMLKLHTLESNAYPLITEVFDNGDFIEYPVQSVHKHMVVSMEYADSISRIPKNGCVCIIANTVEKAVKIYTELDVPENEKILFHSRFTIERRKEIEKIVVENFGKGAKRPRRMILVATQVVEQSLDVDFDLLYTELAPIDLVFQRIGRLHRHDIERPKGLEQPRCIVFADGLGTGKYIYYTLLLERSKNLLETTTKIHIPEDISPMIEIVYNDDPNEDEIDAWMEKDMDMHIKKGAAIINLLQEPVSDDFGLYEDNKMGEDDTDIVHGKTRFGSDGNQFCLLPEYLFKRVVTERHIDSNLVKEVYKYCVSCNNSYRSLLDKNECKEGEGKVFGITFVKALKGESPTDTLIGNGFKVDRILGLVRVDN